jgi:DNA polymerase-3 subunit epsilon
MLRSAQRLFHYVSLGDRSYEFLFRPGPQDEAVVIDCETTGLNPKVDEIVAIAAVMVRGSRILLSERFEAVVRPDSAPTSTSIKVHHLRAADVETGRPMHKVVPELLHFIGGRPIVGYYVDFDIRMIDKYVLPHIQAQLPNPRIEISEIYYGLKYRTAPPGTAYDLRFAAILGDLGIPSLGQHDALNDAVMTAMAYLQLLDMRQRGIRLARARSGESAHLPTGA